MSTRAIPRTWTFTVKGMGPFPIDMLRYDRCTPRHESDSGHIDRTFRRDSSRYETEVTLVSAKRPTEGRWASFGWSVESVE